MMNASYLLKASPKQKGHWVILFAGILLVAALVAAQAVFPLEAQAKINKPRIVVSLGDSYSSGESVAPYYGTPWNGEGDVSEDWVAHRSTNSWGGKLKLYTSNGLEVCRDSRVFAQATSYETSDLRWYFVASSGAETQHMYVSQEKNLNRDKATKTVGVAAQFDVFDKVDAAFGEGAVDYVTISIGGNDAGFTDVVTKAATGFFGVEGLSKKLAEAWEKYDATIRDNLVDVYNEIISKAGPQAKVIVVGYPELFGEGGSGFLISEEESALIDAAVRDFNTRIQGLVEQLNAEGKNIYFVGVEGEFNGHEAYTNDNYIEPIHIMVFGNAPADEIDETAMASSSSVHPNGKGTEAYARAVQAKIDELENQDTRMAATDSPTKNNNGIRTVERTAVVRIAADDGTDMKNPHLKVKSAKTDEYMRVELSGATFCMKDLLDAWAAEHPNDASPSRIQLKIYAEDELNAVYVDLALKNEMAIKKLTISTEFPGTGTTSPLVSQADLDASIQTTSNVALVMDVSGSMRDDNKLADAQDAASDAIAVILATGKARMGLVSFENQGYAVMQPTCSASALALSAYELTAGGGTNIESGLRIGYQMVSSSTSKQIIILLSDGLPNNGLQGDELVNYAQELKNKGVIIYVMGYGVDAQGQQLLRRISSSGCFYQINEISNTINNMGVSYGYGSGVGAPDLNSAGGLIRAAYPVMTVAADSNSVPVLPPAPSTIEEAKVLAGITEETAPEDRAEPLTEVEGVMQDIADIVTGVQYEYLLIDGPVDVTITNEQGETLTSVYGEGSRRTTWGSVSVENTSYEDYIRDMTGSGTSSKDDSSSGESGATVQVFRLREGQTYQVDFQGTQSGSFNYRIGYMNVNGVYEDFRSFESILITPQGVATTTTDRSSASMLSVDADGDGSYESQYRAEANGTAVLFDNEPVVKAALNTSFVFFGGIAAICLVCTFFGVLKRRRKS